MMGKIEIESLEEGRDAQIAENLVKAAVLTVFKDRFTPGALPPDRHRVRGGRGDPRRRGRHLRRVRRRCSSSSRRCARRSPTSPAATSPPPSVASAVELLLEGLHLSKRLNKDAVGARATYRARGPERVASAISAAGLGLRSRSKRPKRTSKPWPHS